jgi:HTH-type transcriptional regulator, transcriptional repressor of NAD biosynthesis genes
MARFKRGLVVGKFSPLHRGHEALIRCAQEACDEVIIISYSKPEFAGCEASTRALWLAELFATTRRLLVTDQFLREPTCGQGQFTAVPENDAPDAVHREFCGFLCETYFGGQADAVFTSEDYGDGFAEHLTRRLRARSPQAATVAHVCVDRQRANVPVSGSLIRTDIHAHRNWVSPFVYARFVQRICLLGGESSGKSTLAEALAERLETAFVPEYGRELWTAKKGLLAYDDMVDIARRQIEREHSAAQRSHRYLVCDTSALTTLFYSLDMFGQAHTALEEMALRPYDFYVLCAPDFEFVQDGTRRDSAFRQRQHAWYLEQLNHRGVRHLLAEGSLGARVERIVEYLGGELSA